MIVSFTADEKIAEIAAAYSLDAIDIARANFGKDLDWSEASVELVEDILTELHDAMASERPSDETIWRMSKAFGSYIGEVFRRANGGRWGMVDIEGQQFPGFRANERDVTFWPWGRVHNRLSNGPEDNVWHYYRALLD